MELVTATAILTNSAVDSERWCAARQDFWVLYWGAIPLVADVDVGLAIDEFSILLDRPVENEVALRNASMNLARVCRRSLGYVIDDGNGSVRSAGVTATGQSERDVAAIIEAS